MDRSSLMSLGRMGMPLQTQCPQSPQGQLLDPAGLKKQALAQCQQIYASSPAANLKETAEQHDEANVWLHASPQAHLYSGSCPQVVAFDKRAQASLYISSKLGKKLGRTMAASCCVNQQWHKQRYRR